MPDQNQPNDPTQNPVPGDDRPVLTTEEVPAVSSTPSPTVPPAEPPPPVPEVNDTPLPPLPGASGTAAPLETPPSSIPSFDLPPVVGAPPRKKFGGKKVISTILGLLLLVGGVGAGVTLVRQQQDIRERAGIIGTPTEAPKAGAIKPTEAPKAGAIKPTEAPKAGAIKPAPTQTPGGANFICSGTCEVSQTICTNKGGTPTGNNGNLADNGDCGAGQICCVVGAPAPGGAPAASPTSPPPGGRIPPPGGATAQCLNIKAYDEEFSPLTVDQLKALKAGDIVRFAVAGSATSGSFDRARFKVNTGSFIETTTKVPNSQEYYYEFTIPEGVASFSITAQIHHTSLGWSN